MSEPTQKDENNKTTELEKRRQFLRKSAYAASAAPVMLALMHARKAAAGSCQPDPTHPSVWQQGNGSCK